MQATTQLSTIGQISMQVSDLERAVRFYRDALGVKQLFNAGEMAFFDCDGLRLMLTLPEEATANLGSSVLYFAVADIQVAFQRLVDNGVPFLDQPHMVAQMPEHELWMTFFRDSEGNLLSLMSEVRVTG